MQSVGVLICGYDQEDARSIKAFLDKTLETYVIMVSASRKAEMRIIDILKKGSAECFAEEETKILMFLGFSEVQIHMVLEGFPRGRRPEEADLLQPDEPEPAPAASRTERTSRGGAPAVDRQRDLTPPPGQALR
jgi:hypothetical protein